jgi:hypothetical protein
MPFYCGNNGNSPLLVANGGNRVLGSRHDCLRQGIGVGLHMPLDPSYLNPYNPINNTRYYCGNAAVLPAGYDANGTLNMCHGIGIGVGRRKRAAAAPLAALPPLAGGAPLAVAPPLVVPPAPLAGGSVAIYLICFVLMISIFVITMLYKKPTFIKKKDTEEIDWYVFSPYIALFSIVVGITLYIIYKRIAYF